MDNLLGESSEMFLFFLGITPMGEMTISENGGLSYGSEMRLSDSFLDVVLPRSNLEVRYLVWTLQREFGILV